MGYLCANFGLPRPLCSRLRPDVRRQTDVRRASSLNASALWSGGIITKQVSVTAASMSAGTDVLRHCVLNDFSQTAVESKLNLSCNHRMKVQNICMYLQQKRSSELLEKAVTDEGLSEIIVSIWNAHQLQQQVKRQMNQTIRHSV